ncbi:hypothetical protein BDD12DRAFT_487755 [Trichophaea hybrida]|nr:hypothetical protein BDD12DRAFT_487755 [Trichophaea hybrida]
MRYLILSLALAAFANAQQGGINQIADGQIQALSVIPTLYTPPVTKTIGALVPEPSGSAGAGAIPNNDSGSYSGSYSGSGTSVSYGSGSGSGSYGSGSSSGSGSAGSYGTGSESYGAGAVAGLNYGITPTSVSADIYVSPVIAPTSGANGIGASTPVASGPTVEGDAGYTTGETAIITEDGEIVTLPAIFEGGANRGIEGGWRFVGLMAMAGAVAVGMM